MGAGLERCTAAGQVGALPLADFHVLYDGPALRVADQWADLGRGIEPVTNPQRSGTRNESIQKGSIHFFMDDNPTGRGASLSGRAKTAPQAAFHCQFQICVLHDHHDVLATHFEVDFLEGRCRLLSDRTADVGRSGERHHAHVLAGEERTADRLAAAGDEIDDSRRHASFLQNLDEAQG